jgi:CRP-like cAMP-binding protein
MQAGTVGTCMYIVDAGRVGITVGNKQIGELSSGHFFGEVSSVVAS